MDNIYWRVTFSVFYYSTLFVMVYFILQLDWGKMEAFDVIKNVGILGGLYYFGELFGKEMKEAKTKPKEHKK